MSAIYGDLSQRYYYHFSSHSSPNKNDNKRANKLSKIKIKLTFIWMLLWLLFTFSLICMQWHHLHDHWFVKFILNLHAFNVNLSFIVWILSKYWYMLVKHIFDYFYSVLRRKNVMRKTNFQLKNNKWIMSY